jgi:hypothetical protein
MDKVLFNNSDKPEYILCAAVWFNDGIKHEHQPNNIKSGYVVCGQRHHNCFNTLSIITDKNLKEMNFGKCILGFLTSKNIFLNREKSGILAFKIKQINKPTKCLFSEDLY